MVVKTKRNRKRSGTKKNYCKNPATMNGLNEWYNHMFKDLGWIVLAKRKGHMNDRVISYKHSLKRLQEKLKCKINEVNCPDKKNDLTIMLSNVNILLSHAMKDLR